MARRVRVDETATKAVRVLGVKADMGAAIKATDNKEAGKAERMVRCRLA